MQPAALGKERKMAIPMPKQQDIRRLDRQGVSRSEIARRPDVDRATVAKYADMDDMTPKPPTDRRRGSKIDPYAALVDGWLEADRMLPRKQRHTAKRVHDRLRAETEYDDEYTTTLRYVRRWRETNRSGSDGYGELVWAPGVAQIDFGVAKARIAGELVDDHCLAVTFPHSNMRYVTSLPGENAECLCHGPIEVFEHIGGVPPVIVMDNATGAGRRNARGEVTPAAVFDAFLAHHRIDARFCNPYSGWEKGAVENAVGFLRRNLMVPPLEAETHTQLGRIMLDRCDALAASSRHYRRGNAIGDAFEEDRAALMPLPSTTFDPIRWESRRADKYGQIDIDSNRYLAGAALHGRRLLAAVRWDSVQITDPDTGEIVAGYPRIYGRSPSTLQDPELAMPVLAAKPGSWRESSIRPDFPEDVRVARRGRFQTPRAEPQIDRRGMRRRRFRQRGRGREPGDSRQARLGVGRIHARHPRPARTRRRRRRHHRRRARPGRIRPVHHRGRRKGDGAMNGAHGRNTARRRRADTIARCERIMETARRLPLTRDVLAEAIERATPAQLDLMEGWLDAEIESRERSKRARLLKAAGFPNAKDIEGYDWSNLRMPADWGRAQLATLDFVDRCEDRVLYGPVGTGKTHLAVALGRIACMRAIPAGFFTATGLLMRLRRAKREDRLDAELRQIAKARLPVIDEFGYMPIDEEGSRLLFQVISDYYETRSVIYTTNIEFSGWGRVLGDKNMATALIDRTVHHGRLVRFEGGSYRSEHALMTR